MKDKKRPMGRGLGAILNTESKNNIHTANDEGARSLVGQIVEVSIDDIFPNPNQPRTFFDQEALNDLASSIKSLGIIQPITLRKDGTKFEIISGERRFRASKIAGIHSIPAYIRLVNDQELVEMALVENIQREDLDDIEIALTYQRLINEIGLTQENLSLRLGVERPTITNSLRLLKLKPQFQQALRRHEISAGHARCLLRLDIDELQMQVFDKILSQNLNVRQTEILVKSIIEEKPLPKNKISNEKVRKIQEQLSEKITSKVEVKSSGKNKGKIILDFKNQTELEHILTFFK